jgi:hypothetical protein
MSKGQKNLAKEKADADFKNVVEQICVAIGHQVPNFATDVPISALGEFFI